MIYEYKCECGEETDRSFQMGKASKTVACDKCSGRAKRTFRGTNAVVRHRLGESRIGRGKGY